MFNAPNTPLEVVVFIGIILWFIGGGSFAVYRRRKRAPMLKQSSVLLMFYTHDAKLVPTSRTKVADVSIVELVATNIDKGSLPAAALIYKVILPFATTVHLLGVPKQTGAVQLDPVSGGGLMEHVTLEGDYHDYFDLFCEKGMQQQARYVLDPKAMAHTIDFCQTHSWEIVGNELILVTTSEMQIAGASPDQARKEILDFIKEIRPALERPLTKAELAALAPYGEDYRDNLKCPVCKQHMKNNQQYHSCPNGHGILITGAQLIKLKKNSLRFTKNSDSSVRPNINCPSCGQAMHEVAYAGSATTIDSCTKCPYRWLDAHDYQLS